MTDQPDDATRAQISAADPSASTWLAANAGSGKTRVLTDRVARLLLQGVDPQKILCLTYTKAAASEMQNRLFRRLGAWAMQPDADLRAAIAELGERALGTPEDLARARTLFARAIETPGGLKIQTIHSFCSGILRRFPLEAGVSPLFQEIEERAAQILQTDIVDAMAVEGQDSEILGLARYFTSGDLPKLLASIVQHREVLSKPKSWEEIADGFAIAPDFSVESAMRTVFTGEERALFDELVPLLLASSAVTDQRVGAKLSAVSAFDADCLPLLEDAFLTQGGTCIKALPTKKTADAAPHLVPPLRSLMERVEQWRVDRLTFEAAQKTHALHQFAAPFLTRYRETKQLRGWLDFDDLILRTRDLLSNSSVAAWVLYRLDGGISHILVDEAQDTSPAQWDVIRLLVEEFTAGDGAGEATRTLFVVGDKKQSIYSFQGARPDAFDQMQREFSDKFRAAGARFETLPLLYSFRSSTAIMDLVDRVFENASEAGFGPDTRHRAFHRDKPGRIDLWPVVEKRETKDDREWTDPVDLIPDSHHTVVLAGQVADQIGDLLENGTIPEREGDGGTHRMRRVRAGDILILVQSRARLFNEIIRACKGRNLPIAGSDRLRVGAELAVRDLLALLSFLATPEDSLSLATVLRSPLFGWSEQELFTLAHHRTQTHLWEALRNSNAHPQTRAVLRDLRTKVDFLRPYDLLERTLTRHGGRKALLARLGQEAEDGIDALLSQALAYERSAVPSLTGFLSWAQADDLEIKRQMDASGNMIRVMTVHGAKGLEAPIVILPDCAQRPETVRDEILKSGDLAVWKVPKEHRVEAVETARSTRQTADAQERLRLLYVAMTRAEFWLIVAAAGDLSKEGTDWYQTVQAGMTKTGAAPHDFANGVGMRMEYGDWSGDVREIVTSDPAEKTSLEPFFTQPIEEIPERAVYLSPSDLDGEKALPGEGALDEETAMARGTYMHGLLERLAHVPAPERDARSQDVAPPPELRTAIHEQARAEALAVLGQETLSWIFTQDALAEVTLSGEIEGKTFLGTVDWLHVEPDRVTAIDIKTNAVAPATADACPEGILRQMGAYERLLAQIYPEREIRVGILWTATGEYMPLPHDLVSRALNRSARLDAGRDAT